jgi:hypothetical protein
MEYNKVGPSLKDQSRFIEVIELLRNNPHQNIVSIYDRVYFFNGMDHTIME